MRSIPIILLLLISFISACDILATLESQTHHHVFAQFTFPNDTVSPVYEFTGDKQKKEVRMKAMICNNKPTKLEIFNQPPAPGLKPVGLNTVFLEGMGFVNYVILKDGVFMGARAGVACAAGDCGAARG